jgi:phosphinothricin acetyltransferase
VRIRPARTEDLAAVIAIYNHYIEHSHVTFDTEPIILGETDARFRVFSARGSYRLLVADFDHTIIGYAGSMPFRPKPAYSTSVELAVYVSPTHTGCGVGAKLYAPLLQALEAEDVHRAYAVIVLPNPASIRLHEQCGFKQVAVLEEAGRKFGRYWDVTWWERSLDPL